MWCWDSPARIGVSITAGAMQLTRTPLSAASLPIAFVIAITAAFLAGDRGDEDDPAVAALDHPGQDRPAHVERSVRVDREDALPLVVADLRGADRLAGDPGRVDQHVDPAELAFDPLDGRVDV